MKYYTESIKAGKSATINTAGRIFLIDDVSNAGSVDILLLRAGSTIHDLKRRKTAFKCVTEFDGVVLSAAVDTTVSFFISFDDVQIGLAAGSGVAVPDGVVITNPIGNPVQVAFAGTVAPVLGNVTITNAAGAPVPTYFPTTPAVTISGRPLVDINSLPNVTIVAMPNVTVGAMPNVTFAANQAVLTAAQALITNTTPAQATVGVAAASVINDPTLKRIIFRNVTASGNIYLGGSTVTAANAAIVLNPGDVFVDDVGAAANWYAIADNNGSKLNMQTLK